MALLPGLRKLVLARPRRVVGALAAAWLAMIVQPCAMAFEGLPAADCPHCPSAIEDEHREHHGDHGHAEEHPAEHAADAAPGCDGGLGDCYVLRDEPLESRSPQPKVKDAPTELPLSAALIGETAIVVGRSASACPPRWAAAPPGASPPLTVLYCVYRK